LTATDAEVERVRKTADLDVLDRWVRRAAAADAVEDVFAE